MIQKIANFIFLNGKITHRARARITPWDTGLLYADGVYEVWRAAHGRAHLFAENFAALRQSLRARKIPFQLSSAELEKLLTRLLRKNKLRAARIRLTASRENILIELSPLARFAQRITAFTLPLERHSPVVKSVDWLATVFNLRPGKWWEKSEALLLNRRNEITEGAQSNFFLVKNSQIVTPPATTVHPGAVRRWVLRSAKKLKIPVRERAIKSREIFTADEIFVTDSLSGIRSVMSVDGRKIKSGPLTKILQTEFAKSLSEFE
ncbi:MAG: aminotransferase class IV [Patescibacteria group bacterium]